MRTRAHTHTHTHIYIWTSFSQFHLLDFIVKMPTASTMTVCHNIYHNTKVSVSTNFIHDSFFYAVILSGRVIDSRHFEGVYHLHTQGLRSPRGLKVVCSFQTLGTTSSVTQPNNPKELHHWHQHFINLKSCKVHVHSTQMFGKFLETQ